MLAERREVLAKYIADTKTYSASSPLESMKSFEQKMVMFLGEKAAANNTLHDIYRGEAGKEKEQGFFEASTNAWTKSVPNVVNKLEEIIKGPYALGDQVVSTHHLL